MFLRIWKKENMLTVIAARKNIKGQRKTSEQNLRQIDESGLVNKFPAETEILKDVEIKLHQIDGRVNYIC